MLCCQQIATVPKLYWSKKEGERVVDFDSVPFSVEKVSLYDCHYEEQYKKPKEYKARRLRLQSTHKIGCFAHIKAHTYRLYSEYKTTNTEYVSSHKLRQCKENLLRNAKEAIKAGKAKSHTKHFVSLPMQCAHSGHPVDVKTSFFQFVNPIIVKKIAEVVSAEIVETGDVQYKKQLITL